MPRMNQNMAIMGESIDAMLHKQNNFIVDNQVCGLNLFAALDFHFSSAKLKRTWKENR